MASRCWQCDAFKSDRLLVPIDHTTESPVMTCLDHAPTPSWWAWTWALNHAICELSISEMLRSVLG